MEKSYKMQQSRDPSYLDTSLEICGLMLGIICYAWLPCLFAQFLTIVKRYIYIFSIWVFKCQNKEKWNGETVGWHLARFLSHCYFCLLALLGIHRHPMLIEFLKSCEGFLRAALMVHGHPGPVWKIAKMALFDLCMDFEIFLGLMTSFEVVLKCHSLTLSKKCLRLRPAPSKC